MGKTTLCKTLTQRLNNLNYPHQYCHFTRLPDAHDRCDDYVSRISPIVVQDRFHMSEVAYVYGRNNPNENVPVLTCDKVRWVDACLRGVGAFTVLLTANEDVITSRFQSRGDDMYKLDVIHRANECFIMLAQREFGRYIFDIDVHLHFKNANDYPTQDQAGAILTAYIERQTRLKEIVEASARRY